MLATGRNWGTDGYRRTKTCFVICFNKIDMKWLLSVIQLHYRGKVISYTGCPCPCFVFLSGLSCTIYICIWLPFLPYAYYMWLPWFVLFLFLGFSPPESLPGDDVLCSFFHARFLLSAFFSFLCRGYIHHIPL